MALSLFRFLLLITFSTATAKSGFLYLLNVPWTLSFFVFLPQLVLTNNVWVDYWLACPQESARRCSRSTGENPLHCCRTVHCLSALLQMQSHQLRCYQREPIWRLKLLPSFSFESNMSFFHVCYNSQHLKVTLIRMIFQESTRSIFNALFNECLLSQDSEVKLSQI